MSEVGEKKTGQTKNRVFYYYLLTEISMCTCVPNKVAGECNDLFYTYGKDMSVLSLRGNCKSESTWAF